MLRYVDGANPAPIGLAGLVGAELLQSGPESRAHRSCGTCQDHHPGARVRLLDLQAVFRGEASDGVNRRLVGSVDRGLLLRRSIAAPFTGPYRPKYGRVRGLLVRPQLHHDPDRLIRIDSTGRPEPWARGAVTALQLHVASRRFGRCLRHRINPFLAPESAERMADR